MRIFDAIVFVGVATDRLLARWGDMETAEKEWGPKHALGRLGQPDEMLLGWFFLRAMIQFCDRSRFIVRWRVYGMVIFGDVQW